MSPATPVDAIPPLDHDEAIKLAEAEISRLPALVDDLRADEWQRLTEMTALQVREQADLSTDSLRRALHETATRGLAARRAFPAGLRTARYDPELPGAEHDGRIVENVVADWAPRHGRPFILELTGLAGATFTAGTDGVHLRMDAIGFCRTLSGRDTGTGILATPVTF